MIDATTRTDLHAAVRPCPCAECRRLDKNHPREGAQLRLPAMPDDDKTRKDIR